MQCAHYNGGSRQRTRTTQRKNSLRVTGISLSVPCVLGGESSVAVIECIANVSEGRRPEIIAAMADAIRGTADVRLLDQSSDTSHNRSVFTFAGDPAAVEAAVLALAERAVADID